MGKLTDLLDAASGGRYVAYVDGSCLKNPDGPGGWGVVLIGPDECQCEFAGAAAATTNNRMEMTAAIEALRRVPEGQHVVIRSDSQYVVKTANGEFQRRANLDLWEVLDREAAARVVIWEWVRGHVGNRMNERADRLAGEAARAGTVSDPAARVALLDRIRNERDRKQRRGYDYNCEAPSHREYLESIGENCACLRRDG